MQKKWKTRTAFTLIELLLVIAILGILVGLIFPAISYGKFKARVTTCTNNYRQLALAAAMYAGDDSKGRLPSFQLPTVSGRIKLTRPRSLQTDPPLAVELLTPVDSIFKS